MFLFLDDSWCAGGLRYLVDPGGERGGDRASMRPGDGGHIARAGDPALV
jgi:hypothetical protein